MNTQAAPHRRWPAHRFIKGVCLNHSEDLIEFLNPPMHKTDLDESTCRAITPELRGSLSTAGEGVTIMKTLSKLAISFAFSASLCGTAQAKVIFFPPQTNSSTASIAPASWFLGIQAAIFTAPLWIQQSNPLCRVASCYDANDVAFVTDDAGTHPTGDAVTPEFSLPVDVPTDFPVEVHQNGV